MFRSTLMLLPLVLFALPAAEEKAPPPKKETFSVKGVSFNLCLIPAGSFMMGTEPDDIDHFCQLYNTGWYSNEIRHQVTLTKPFYMGETEVTQDLYEAVMGQNPSLFQGPRRPVEQVSWEDAVEFCERLSRKIGRTFRLPTEAEWEYACRAGTRTAFPYGDDLSARMANFEGRYPCGKAPKGEYRQATTDAASFKANPWGLFDVVGNVWEWCADWYAPYAKGSATDPTGPAKGSDRVYRGGSWDNYGVDCRAASRNWHFPVLRLSHLGFRLAASVP